jgi:hypothetical protein
MKEADTTHHTDQTRNVSVKRFASLWSQYNVTLGGISTPKLWVVTQDLFAFPENFW